MFFFFSNLQAYLNKKQMLLSTQNISFQTYRIWSRAFNNTGDSFSCELSRNLYVRADLEI